MSLFTSKDLNEFVTKKEQSSKLNVPLSELVKQSVGVSFRT